MMAKTVGDTSKSFPAPNPRFIAVDENATDNGGPLNAAVTRRLIRNSNWTEAKHARTLFCQPFQQDDDGTATRDSAALAGNQIIWRGDTAQCFGMWQICTNRREIKCQVGYGLGAGQSMRYYFELRSENLHGDIPDGLWKQVTNAGGAAAWYDSASHTKKTRPGEEDWVRLWILPEGEGIATLTANGGGGDDAAGTVVDVVGYRGDTFVLSNTIGIDPDFQASDFTGNTKTLIIYRGTHGASPVLAGPIPIGEPRDGDGDTQNESVLVTRGVGPERRAEILDTAQATREYEIHEHSSVSLRYVMAQEAQYSSVSESTATRGGFTAMDDKVGHIGEKHLADLAMGLAINADHIALDCHQTIVNQVFDDADPLDAKYVHSWGEGDGWWSAEASEDDQPPIWGFFAEENMDNLECRFLYITNATDATRYKLQARVRLLDIDDANPVDSTAVDFFAGVRHRILPDGTVPGTEITDGSSFWPGDYYNRYGAPFLSPVIEMDISSYTGEPNGAHGMYGIQLDIQDDFSSTNGELTIVLLGVYIVAKGNR